MTEATPTAESKLPVVVPAKDEVVNALTTSGKSIHDRVTALTVDGAEGLEAAAKLLGDIAAVKKEIKADLGGPKQRAHELHAELSGIFKKHWDPVHADEVALKGKVGTYNRKVEAERRQEIEAANRAAEARAADTDARLDAAVALDEAGDTEGAEAVLGEHPATAPPPVAAAAMPKGMSSGKTWKAEIMNMPALIQAAAGGDALALSILDDEEGKVKEAAQKIASKIAKGMMARFKCPGCRPYYEDRISRR